MARVRSTSVEPVHKSRHCGQCGERYLRRNLTEIWDTRNVGHRAGWHKTMLRICCACLSEKQAARVLVVAQITKPERGPARGAREVKG